MAVWRLYSGMCSVGGQSCVLRPFTVGEQSGANQQPLCCCGC